MRTAPKDSINWSPQIVLFGDMGNENAQSLSRLQEETERGLYDAAIHVGDFAYDMHTDDARVGDEFMRQIESIAAYIPYMTVPGNHEERYNFSNYRSVSMVSTNFTCQKLNTILVIFQGTIHNAW